MVSVYFKKAVGTWVYIILFSVLFFGFFNFKINSEFLHIYATEYHAYKGPLGGSVG